MSQRFYIHAVALPAGIGNDIYKFSCSERALIVGAGAFGPYTPVSPASLVFQTNKAGAPIGGDGVVAGGFPGIPYATQLLPPGRVTFFRLPQVSVVLYVMTEDSLRPVCDISVTVLRQVAVNTDNVVCVNTAGGTEYYDVTNLPAGKTTEQLFPVGSYFSLDELPGGVTLTLRNV